MNNIVIAFSIKPNEGSEYGVGWNWIQAISAISDNITVIVRDAEGQKDAINAYLENNHMPNTKFYYYELPKPFRNIVKGESHTGQKGMRRYYILWQLGTLFYILKNFKVKEFDILQHVTFVSDWIPSLYCLLGVKHLVLGPMGSQNCIPKQLGYPVKIIIKDRIANIIKYIFRTANPIFRYSLKKADAIIGISNETINKIKGKKYCSKFHCINPITIDHRIEPNKTRFPLRLENGETVIVFSASEFLYFKNFPLIIEAFSEFKKINSNSKLLLAGDGPDRQKIESLIKINKLENDVELLGWVKINKVHEILRHRAHVLLYPTSESGGTISVEALRFGVPVVCLKGYGYNYFVQDSKASISVDIDEKKQVVMNLARSIKAVTENITKYSENAYLESERFVLSYKIGELKKIYTGIMNA